MLRKSPSVLGSFLIFDKLVVDWKHFFERLDLKNLADARLNDGIAAHKRSIEKPALDKDMLFRGGRQAPEAEEQQAVDEVTQEPVEDGMSRAHSGTIGSCLAGHDGSLYDPNYFRLAEDGTGIVAVNRGKPLGVDEANYIAKVFTQHHDVDGLAEVFRYLQEDLGVATTSDHYNQLLRVLLFARDRERVDQTLEAVFDADRSSGVSSQPQPSTRWGKELEEGSLRGESYDLVTHDTLARLVDSCYAFKSPDDALQSALQVIGSFQHTRKLPIIQVCTDVFRADPNSLFSSCSVGSHSDIKESVPEDTHRAMCAANSLLRDLIDLHADSHLESKPLSSLLHLTSQGNFHALIPLVVATWMSLLGVRLSAWDLANLSAVLVSRPQDFSLVRAVFASMEEPQKDAAHQPASLPSGSVSIHAMLYTLHARGFFSDASFGRLRNLVLKLNLAVNETLVAVNDETDLSKEESALHHMDSIVDDLFVRLKVDSKEAPAATSIIGRSFGRLKADKDKSVTIASLLDGSSAEGQKPRHQGRRRDAEFSYDTPRFLDWFNEFTEFATTRDELAVKALPYQLEAIFACLIETVATTSCLQRPVLDPTGGKWKFASLHSLPVSSRGVPQEVTCRFGNQKTVATSFVPMSSNELAGVLKAPISVGWLNCREAAGSNIRMVLSMYDHSWGTINGGRTILPSVGPQRENIGGLYHYYATLQATVRHETETVRALSVTSEALTKWEATFAPLYSEIFTGMRAASLCATDSSMSPFERYVSSRKDQLTELQRQYFPSANKSHDSKYADICKRDAPTTLFSSLTPPLINSLSAKSDVIFKSDLAPTETCNKSTTQELSPILSLLAEVAASAPFALNGMFFDDIGFTFPSVPMAVLNNEMAAFQALTSAALNPLVLRLKREHLLDHPELSELFAPLGLSPVKVVAKEEEEDGTIKEETTEATPPPLVPVYHSLSEADQNYLAAHGLYFLDSTVAAQKAWSAIEASAEGLDLPNRSVKKMLKLYGAMCARHPPRNCKLSAKGYEERLKFGLYVEARETALMLLGSGKESREMMRHLFYNSNKLPTSRPIEKIVEDVNALATRLPINPVARYSAERLREETERVLGAISTLRKVSEAGDYAGDEQLEVVKTTLNSADDSETAPESGDVSGGVVFVVKGKEQSTKAGKRYDAHDFTNSSTGSASVAIDDLFVGSSGSSVADLHEFQRRAKLRVNGNLASVDMALSAVFSEAVRRANPNTLPGPTGSGSASSSVPDKADGTSAHRTSFTTEVSWIRGHPSVLLPEHLFRGDIYNHFPHKNIKGMGILRETQEVVALSGGSTEERLRLAKAISSDVSLLEDGQQPAAPKTDAVVSVPSGVDEAPIQPMTFFGYDDQFTEDPFIPLWNFINSAYSPTSSTSVSGRAWYLDDIEMFELLLRNLLYRLDWENAAKLTLLMTQTPRSKKSREHLEKLRGSKYNNRNQKTFLDVMTSRTNEIMEESVGVEGEAPLEAEVPTASGSSEWSFLTDHHISKIFADIGDPGGFLPFKVAVKLFDGRIVTKTNRMGAVNVNTLLTSADIAFDDDSDNRPSLHGAEKRRGAAGIGFRQ